MARLASEFGTVKGVGSKTQRGSRIDLGIALLHLAAKPGVPLSRADQAAWCDCSESAIYLIEQTALRKLRNRLLFLKDPILREAIDSLLTR